MLAAMGDPIERHLASTGSTQDEVRALAGAGAAAWSVVSADEQTAGRGRAGRRWVTPGGGAAMLSVLLRPTRPAHELGVLSLAGGLAACRVARAQGVPAGLGWPNDVLVDGRKLAGVLAELVEGPAVILGIGMNVSQTAAALPPTDRRPATSIAAENGRPLPVAVARRMLLVELRGLVAEFERDGPGPVVEAARSLDVLRGRTVVLALASGSEVRGTADGIADDGALLVRTAAGVEAHHAGEVIRTA